MKAGIKKVSHDIERKLKKEQYISKESKEKKDAKSKSWYYLKLLKKNENP